MKAFLPFWIGLAAFNPHRHAVVAEEVLNYQPEILESLDGLLEVTLTVDMVTSLNGDRIAPGYNGQPIGPTLRLKVGDTLRLTLDNALEPNTDVDVELFDYIMTSNNDVNVSVIANRLGEYGTPYSSPYGWWGANYQNIHLHGAGINPSLEDNAFWVNGGESKTYEIVIATSDDWSRFAWYHNHIHGLAVHSMFSGLYGMIDIVGSDDHITTIPEVAEATEVFLMLGESTLVPETTDPKFAFPVVFDFSWRHVTNGHYGDDTVFTFKTGETVLFRAASASIEPPMPLSIDEHMLWPIAYDGFPVTELAATDILDLHAGARAEFMVKFETPGNYTFRRNAFNFGISGPVCEALFFVAADTCISFDKDTVVGTIVVEDEEGFEEQNLPTTLPETSSYIKELEDMATVGSTRMVDMVLIDGPAAYPVFQVPCLEDESGECVIMEPPFKTGMNDRLFNPMYSEGVISAGTCETWEVSTNFPVAGHTFHMHSVPFLITHRDGNALDPPVWRDTAPVYSNMTIHVCFPEDHVGLLLAHCHMPAHQDTGMAIYYELVPPGTDDAGSAAPTDIIDNAPGTTAPTDAPTSSPTDASASSSGSYIFTAVMVILSFSW